MNIGILRIGFAIFWFAIAIVLIFRTTLAPDQFARISGQNLELAAILALALGFWNGVRWYLGRVRVVPQKPIPSRNLPDRKEEYIPELDFTRPTETADRLADRREAASGQEPATPESEDTRAP